MASEVMDSRGQVNYLKGLAILAVVTIHIVNTLYRLVQTNGFSWITLVTVDQLSRFCVPFFVALSGYALAKKYSASIFNWKDFYINRTLRLLPLYFLWTLVYFISGKINSSFDNFGTLALWIKMIIGGQGYYHLYFVPMIFTAYLVFPLIFWGVKKYPWIGLLVSGMIQFLIFFWINRLGWNDQIQYILFPTWQIYFVAGIFLAFVNIKKIAKRNIFFWLIAFFGLIWTLTSTFTNLTRGEDLIWATRFTRWPVMIYALGLLLSFMSREEKLTFLKWPKQTIVAFGKHSYLIYLSHVLFLHMIVGGKVSIQVGLTTIIGLLAVLVSIKLKG